jgi:hypothetical protein
MRADSPQISAKPELLGDASMLLRALVVLPALLGLSACVAPIGPVEVTRFHATNIAGLGQGIIVIEPAPGSDSTSLEWQSYQAAVQQQLARLGYSAAPAGAGAGGAGQVALVGVSRQTFRPDRNGGPVSVGIGGSTGSYGTGLGLGIGFDLSGRPAEQTAIRLSVTIRDRAAQTPLWEGRADFSVRSSAPLAQTRLAAPKLAEALFARFPGNSGETISVR